MDLSLHSESISKLKNNLHDDFFMRDALQQTWNCQGSELKLCLLASSLVLMAKHIECKIDSVKFVGAFIYQNGLSFTIPAAYQHAFLEIINKNGQNICFHVSEDRNQLLLTCSLQIFGNLPTLEKIKQCIKCIQCSLPAFQIALQTVGLTNSFSKHSLRMKKSSLKIWRDLSQNISNNVAKDQNINLNGIKTQNSSVVLIKQITQNPQEMVAQKPIKRGGYFEVQKKSSIITKQSGQKQQKQMAWKTPILKHNSSQYSEAKIQKQIQLVQKVVSNKYLLTYYFNKNSPSSIYMDYVPGLLKDYIYQRKLSTQNLVDLAQQIVEAIAILHKSKIVHRDLKPDNILIDGNTIKVIDYAESTTMDEKFVGKHFLGSTVPYSPIQCILGHQQGFNKSQIDLWSLPMMLYEMAFKSLPLFYTRWIGNEILQKWRNTNEFSIFPIYRKRKGMMSIESIISLLSIRGLQIKPQYRLSLSQYNKILNEIKQFNESILKMD